MELTSEYKEAIAKQLLSLMTKALQENTVTELDLQEMAEWFSLRTKTMTTRAEMTAFIAELAAKWPVLAPLVTLETAKAKEAEEVQVAQNVTELVRTGNLDDALQVAKSATRA